MTNSVWRGWEGTSLLSARAARASVPSDAADGRQDAEPSALRCRAQPRPPH